MSKRSTELVKSGGAAFLAARPAVIPFLTGAGAHGWGWLVEFHGTLEELVAVGLATREMFDGLGKSLQRTRLTAHGDLYTVRKRRGKWDLEFRMRDEPVCGDPMSGDPVQSKRDSRLKLWQENGEAVESYVAGILERFARPFGRSKQS